MLTIGVILGGLLIYGLFARFFARWWLSAAFVLTGLAAVVGKHLIAPVDIHISETVLREVATAALATVLFTEAAVINTKVARQIARVPARLLLIGLPLSIALGAAVGSLIWTTMSFASLLVLATVLAPTDAALGRPVVTNPLVPERVRSALSIESGLNDGLAVPVLLIAIALEAGNDTQPLRLALKVIGLGLVVGLVLGAATGLLVATLKRYDNLDPDWGGVLPALVAIVIYVAADEMGGSGFVAAFVGGIAYGIAHRRRLPVRERELLPSVDVSLLLDGATWFLFGAVPVALLITHAPSARAWLYAILSLTVVRMVPVALSLIGTHAKVPAVAFVGWFGPRGLASVVFVIVFLDTAVPSKESELITQTATLTILLSVIAHGLSATPLARRYGSWAAKNPGPASLS